MKKTYFHSVRLKEDDCKGCTHCMRRCPTDAIRIRNGKAHIMEERCIDCGWCIRICPNHAKYAVSDKLDDLKAYRHTIAIPAPSINGQFPERLGVDGIIGGLIEIGFDEVMEVAFGAEMISDFIEHYIEDHTDIRPLISSACPAVVRLIQVKFPSLIGHIIPVTTPMDISAIYAKKDAAIRLNMNSDDIGVFFISPCPAKVTSVKEPVAETQSPVDGVISISQIYEHLINHIDKIKKRPDLVRSSARGIMWGHEGGEGKSLTGDMRKLSVDGIHNVEKILQRVENGDLDEYDYIEVQACPGGCVGGIFNIEDAFIAEERMDRIIGSMKDRQEIDTSSILTENDFKLKGKVTPRPILLDENIDAAMEKASQINEIMEKLPDIDCGACGSPTCKALAEDIVQGKAKLEDCIVILKEELKKIGDK